jgi:hypothetical protein
MSGYIYTVGILMGIPILLLINFVQYIVLKRVGRRLKQIDILTWLELGSPEPKFFRRGDTGANVLSNWIDQRGYEHQNDGDLTSYVMQYKLLNSVLAVIAVVMICAVVYLRFVTHRRFF